jgi:glycyl-tRNA synthetase alpha chain
MPTRKPVTARTTRRAKPVTLQTLIQRLNVFWEAQGCALLQPYDMEMGAGTFHPATFFGALGPRPTRVAYVQPSRRPTDGRYGENPLRMQRYYQYQVLLKPDPAHVQDLYVQSLEALGIHVRDHDVRFVEDDWESPTLGAWGLGWEVWLDSLEVTQFTYFQQIGGLDVNPTCCEITYGLERIGAFAQERWNVFDLQWSQDTTYGALHSAAEIHGSAYNFDHADVEHLRIAFVAHEQESQRLLSSGLIMPAYEQLLKCSHAFNVRDARGAISVTDRPAIIGRIRRLAVACAAAYTAEVQA